MINQISGTHLEIIGIKSYGHVCAWVVWWVKFFDSIAKTVRMRVRDREWKKSITNFFLWPTNNPTLAMTNRHTQWVRYILLCEREIRNHALSVWCTDIFHYRMLLSENTEHGTENNKLIIILRVRKCHTPKCEMWTREYYPNTQISIFGIYLIWRHATLFILNNKL